MSKWPDDFLYTENQWPNSGTEHPSVKVVNDMLSMTQDGRQRTSQQFVIQDKTFSYDIDNIAFATTSSAGGTITHVSSRSSAKLSVEGVGSRAGLRSRMNVYYVVGQVTSWKTAVTLLGSASLTTWGAYDDTNGFFFEKSGSDMNVVRRSSVDGNFTEVRVSQSDWNVDTMDKTKHGQSELVYDSSRHNMYGITYQWYGSGRTLYMINDRIVHIDDTRAVLNTPSMEYGDLPASFDVYGPGSGSLEIVGSSTRIEGEDPEEAKSGRIFAVAVGPDITVTNDEAHILSIRPVLTSSAGVRNRSTVLPRDAAVITIQDPVILRLYVSDLPPSGSPWLSSGPSSLVEYTTSASFDTSGSRKVATTVVAPGNSLRLHDDFRDIFSFNKESLTVNPYDDSQKCMHMTLESTKPGSTEVIATFRWFEIF